MKIQEIMKENPTCIHADSSVQEAARQMQALACGFLPVVAAGSDNDRQPMGALTDRDIVVRCVAEGADPAAITVRDAYTPGTVSCNETCSVAEAFEKMRAEKVGRLIVVDGAGNLCGVVTMADIIARVPREILDQLPGASAPMARNKAAA